MTLTRSTALRTQLRERKCTVCAEKFKQARPMQSVCSPACAVVQGRADTAKQEAQETRERKAAMKSRTEHLKDTQAAFNAFIRARDAALPCISCGRFHQGAWDAGHYRSVGAQPALRFHEDNVHRQCVPCNQHKSGNAIEYRLGLVARIGAERVAFLEQEHAPAKYTIEQANDIKKYYRAKLRALEKTA